MSFFIAFLFGAWVGAAIGYFVACLMFISRDK